VDQELPPVATIAATEEYDGSTWTNSNTGLNTARNIWKEQEHKQQV
jgi:hypothetical protein